MSENLPAGRFEARLREHGLTLPPPLVMPAQTRTAAVQIGPLLYLSGHGSHLLDDGSVLSGKVGRNITQAQGYAIARAIALKMIATIRWAIGDLDRVAKVVKIFGSSSATSPSRSKGSSPCRSSRVRVKFRRERRTTGA